MGFQWPDKDNSNNRITKHKFGVWVASLVKASNGGRFVTNVKTVMSHLFSLPVLLINHAGMRHIKNYLNNLKPHCNDYFNPEILYVWCLLRLVYGNKRDMVGKSPQSGDRWLCEQGFVANDTKVLHNSMGVNSSSEIYTAR